MVALAAAYLSIAAGHVDNLLLPEGCGSCHVGHGQSGEPMLALSEEEFCYQCHGSAEQQTIMKVQGKLAAQAEPVNVEKEFQKTYRHPVVEGTGHAAGERLPDALRGTVSHAECVDCHSPHQRMSAGSSRRYDVPGYTLSGQYVKRSSAEYEVCLKCHLERTGLGDAARGVLSEFAINVASQHPVTQRATGGRTVSLSASLSSGTIMNCSDCHTNDDPDGPRGPHGSRYESLLSGRYDRDPYAKESPFAFEFCYSCHDRQSILANESFSRHREHILGDPVRNVPGTSCFTCHASHSSRDNPYLIDFNREAVSYDQTTGRLSYSTRGDGTGECYLTCHGYAHGPGSY